MWKLVNGQLVWTPQEPDTGDGKGGSGGGGEGGDDKTDYKAKYEESIASIKAQEAKNKELLGETKKLKDSMKQWEGLDPKNIRNLMEKINNDEELKLISEGKYEDVIKKRTERLSAEYKAQMKTLTDERDKYKTDYEKTSNQVRDLTIDNTIVTEFVAAKGSETAIKDVKQRAREVWRLEDGIPTPRDDKNEIMQGKDGVMTQKEWVESLRISAPHLFPGSQGAGGAGNRGGGGGSDIDSKISAARKAGDIEGLRRLQKEKKNAGRK